MADLKYAELSYHSYRQDIVNQESSGNIQSFLSTRMLLTLKWRRSLDVQEFRVYICKKYEGEEDFINKKLDEIYSYETYLPMR